MVKQKTEDNPFYYPVAVYFISMIPLATKNRNYQTNETYVFQMDQNKYLKKEQILCLLQLGYKPAVVLNGNLDSFNQVLEEQENAEEMLDRSIMILKRQEKQGIFTLPFYHPDFPDELRKIGNDCPPLIHLLGNISLLKRKNAVVVIGARKADKQGCAVAYDWGAKFAKQGYTVVSGLALGCDAAAHQGCLDAKGNIIAIVASGLDITHPKENKPLQDFILRNGGLLLSEQVMGVKANPSRLVARNRLQAALSQAIVVAQCPTLSGTMYTVKFAEQYKKDIYAVPFKSYNENSSGNKLLLESHVAKLLLRPDIL